MFLRLFRHILHKQIRKILNLKLLADLRGEETRGGKLFAYEITGGDMRNAEEGGETRGVGAFTNTGTSKKHPVKVSSFGPRRRRRRRGGLFQLRRSFFEIDLRVQRWPMGRRRRQRPDQERRKIILCRRKRREQPEETVNNRHEEENKKKNELFVCVCVCGCIVQGQEGKREALMIRGKKCKVFIFI